MARKAQETAAIRLAGLDLCDAVVSKLCSRGLIAVTGETLVELEQQERSLQSYKLSRFSREMAAIRTRLGAAIREGKVDASVFAGRLARLRTASAVLRSLLEDPYADSRDIDEISGRTWRESDLERRDNVLLAEMAWESIEIEEGFRVDTSYFPAENGAVLCERKIVPLHIRAAIDDSPKPQRPIPVVYPAIGFYPGDLPRRIKILANPREEEGSAAIPAEHHAVRSLTASAPDSVEAVRRQYLDRQARPFPPASLPFVLRSPRFQYHQGGWRLFDSAGESLQVVLAPGDRRAPRAEECAGALEDTILSTLVEAALLLIHEVDDRIAASVIGVITTERVLRLGLDTD